MLIAVIALVCTLAIYATAHAARRVTTRLGVDPMNMLLWLGLAEWPVEEIPRERPHLP